jgi:predicted RNA binding protein YcfA (HicA-like mRNA interferase family)
LRLPRDLPGAELARLLRRYGYEISRQTGSHIRLTTTMMGTEHHVTIPAHRNLKLGTLASIVTEIAAYLTRDRDNLADELFG